LKFQNNDNQSNEAVRSGQYAIKLPSADSYAMGFDLDSLQPGQHYKISAWRKEGIGKAFLVASSEKEGDFYVQNCEYLKTDEKGWKKVVLDIIIPEKPVIPKIKVYLWNSGNGAVFFDDFTITRIR